jgi:hypothetical protein
VRVQRVVMPWDAVSWTVLDDNRSPVGAVDRFLGFLSSSEKSPNTVKSYAHDLKDWFCYLSGRGLAWDEVSLVDVAGFVAWLPLQRRDGTVAVLGEQAHHYGASTVNRKLAAVASFCWFHARHGAKIMRAWKDRGRAAGYMARGGSGGSCTEGGVTVARCAVERLMRQLGIEGAAARRRKPRATVPATAGHQPADPVGRDFATPAPNRRWVADITYTDTARGLRHGVITDLFSREIVRLAGGGSLACRSCSRRSGNGNLLPPGPDRRPLSTTSNGVGRS